MNLEIGTKGNGMKIKDMVEDLGNIKLERDIKANGKMGRNMEKGRLFGLITM